MCILKDVWKTVGRGRLPQLRPSYQRCLLRTSRSCVVPGVHRLLHPSHPNPACFTLQQLPKHLHCDAEKLVGGVPSSVWFPSLHSVLAHSGPPSRCNRWGGGWFQQQRQARTARRGAAGAGGQQWCMHGPRPPSPPPPPPRVWGCLPLHHRLHTTPSPPRRPAWTSQRASGTGLKYRRHRSRRRRPWRQRPP